MKLMVGIVVLLAHTGILRAAEDFPRYTLVTDSYVIEITTRCSEGSISCDRVRYRSVDKKTGAVLALRGETMHALCADGVSPCRFLGYRFRNGKTYHHVWDDGNGAKGTLEVATAQGKALLTERGTWK